MGSTTSLRSVLALAVALLAFVVTGCLGEDTSSESEDGTQIVSPDGSMVVFARLVEDGWISKGLSLALADGSERRQLTTGNDTEPDWSPDGQRIAFTRTRDLTDNGVYEVDVGSGKIRRLVSEGESPDWSPDGTRIVYVSFLSGGIVVRDLTGNRTRQVAKADFAAVPAWSPDGRSVAFVALPDDAKPAGGVAGIIDLYEIYVTRVDGTSFRRLTRNEVSDFDPEWTSDGRIVFTRSKGGWDERRLVMNADGTGLAAAP